MKKIILFGATGMLGGYLQKYLSEYYYLESAPRWAMDVSRATSKDIDMRFYLNNNCIIINAAGMIPQRGDFVESQMIKVNALWPHELALVKQRRGCEVINITTDCVFEGAPWTDGLLNENAAHDASNIYGKTKSLGENPNITNIRTSIIGEELRNGVSFLEWAKRNKGKKVNGYINHLWNGVTCLELAKIIHNMIDKNHFWNGVRHVQTPYVLSKADMLEQISSVYGLNLEINRVAPIGEHSGVYRALSTVYNDGKLKTDKSFTEQLIELKEFSL
jgi:dTDP-4-dehydrorhamnose reductase